MGCNCKASQYVHQVQKKFGYKSPTKENVSRDIRMKMGIEAVGIWILTIVFFPILLLTPFVVGFFKKSRKINFFNIITVKF
jgi:hypothetical protein